MARTEIERLVVSLEGRLDKYEKAMAKAVAQTNKTARQVESRFQAMGNRVNGAFAKLGVGAFAGLTKGALLALAPILSVRAAVQGAKEALKEFGDISDNAKSTGLDVEFFQSVSQQAMLAGVGYEAAAQGLETFAKNSALAVEGKGKMTAALKALNPELLANIKAATTQEERVRAVADALAATENPALRTAIAMATLGDAKFGDVFRDGAAGIDLAMTKFREMGLIVDRDLIGRAEQLGDEFDAASKVLDLEFKSILVELAPILISTANLIGDVASAVRQVIDLFKGLEQQSTAVLQQRSSDLLKKIKDASEAGTVDPNHVGITYLPNSFASENAGNLTPGLSDAALQSLRDEYAANSAELGKRMSDPAGNGVGAFGDIDSFLNPPTFTDPDESGSGNSAAAAAIKQADAVKELLTNLQMERDALGLTAVEQKTVAALREAGAAATDAQRQEIIDLISATDAESQAIEMANTVMAEWLDTSRQAARSLIDDLIEGKTAAEAFGNVMQQLGSKLIDTGLNGLFGSGSGDGVIGSLLGLGRRERGGPVRAGQSVIVGEKRPEVFTPSQNGIVLPRVPTGGGAQFSFATTINAPNSDAAGLARLEQVVARQQVELEGRVKKIVGRRHKDGW